MPSCVHFRSVIEKQDAENNRQRDRGEKDRHPFRRNPVTKKSYRFDRRKRTDTTAPADALYSFGHCCACPYSEPRDNATPAGMSGSDLPVRIIQRLSLQPRPVFFPRPRALRSEGVSPKRISPGEPSASPSAARREWVRAIHQSANPTQRSKR